ncbi:hypothetical protein TNIN_492701 [Trichonephila inaurata madagascariensis]|uniref:Uncharacterized protein n=1 Tax=Trichonephila inaurata madagascariensis TaxID=2747483 RepID=A0A8X6YLW3_9ARAC|nr:hypothetical protein TNIN_492701 [Trichonephila inaurata madagascariensis]
MLSNAPYSTDISPSNYQVVLSLDNNLLGKQFNILKNNRKKRHPKDFKTVRSWKPKRLVVGSEEGSFDQASKSFDRLKESVLNKIPLFLLTLERKGVAGAFILLEM